ncbi:hypothetical protein JDV02_006762 [Purpureocillium takamizusanense]|uniref:GPI anchored serine-threonine rich protein n=1 Tax=Purpureocillium takamizusanense TaxID=2060973 RepID=A0A9Q8QK77_9HYPO|nr:uncharacterized protein JDV02_006762 [Purpureocillium takamizusanense]UNI20696.1 hypothetical protein JDV02_006762 [Purpureocillium takamizusanense]
MPSPTFLFSCFCLQFSTIRRQSQSSPVICPYMLSELLPPLAAPSFDQNLSLSLSPQRVLPFALVPRPRRPQRPLAKMKFLVPLALLIAAGVSADDKTGNDNKSDCLADYIVAECLSSEEKKAKDCAPADWDCLCAAYEAIATCYNNCPKDARAGPAQQQVSTYCANASLYGSKAMHSKTATGSASSSGAAASATATDSSSSITGTEIFPTKTTGGSSAGATKTNAAEPLAGNAGGLFVALAGAVAALL